MSRFRTKDPPAAGPDPEPPQPLIAVPRHPFLVSVDIVKTEHGCTLVATEENVVGGGKLILQTHNRGSREVKGTLWLTPRPTPPTPEPTPEPAEPPHPEPLAPAPPAAAVPEPMDWPETMPVASTLVDQACAQVQSLASAGARLQDDLERLTWFWSAADRRVLARSAAWTAPPGAPGMPRLVFVPAVPAAVPVTAAPAATITPLAAAVAPASVPPVTPPPAPARPKRACPDVGRRGRRCHRRRDRR
jgi:hypothetical protein